MYSFLSLVNYYCVGVTKKVESQTWWTFFGCLCFNHFDLLKCTNGSVMRWSVLWLSRTNRFVGIYTLICLFVGIFTFWFWTRGHIKLCVYIFISHRLISAGSRWIKLITWYKREWCIAAREWLLSLYIQFEICRLILLDGRKTKKQANFY